MGSIHTLTDMQWGMAFTSPNIHLSNMVFQLVKLMLFRWLRVYSTFRVLLQVKIVIRTDLQGVCIKTSSFTVSIPECPWPKLDYLTEHILSPYFLYAHVSASGCGLLVSQHLANCHTLQNSWCGFLWSTRLLDCVPLCFAHQLSRLSRAWLVE